jgi:hypothetical protein
MPVVANAFRPIAGFAHLAPNRSQRINENQLIAEVEEILSEDLGLVPHESYFLRDLFEIRASIGRSPQRRAPFRRRLP